MQITSSINMSATGTAGVTGMHCLIEIAQAKIEKMSEVDRLKIMQKGPVLTYTFPSLMKALQMHRAELLDCLTYIPSSDYFYCERKLQNRKFSTK